MERRRHYVYPDPASLAGAFACEVSNFLMEVSDSGKPVHVALSGGSTPLSIFKQLKDTTLKEHWTFVRLYWVDERCVPPDHEESNYGNALKSMIQPLDLPGEHLHRIRGEEDPASEAARYGQMLSEQLPVERGVPVFDWIWLGMGEDGHTASIFPDQLHLWNSPESCAVATHPGTGQKRITLTGNVINAARRVSFLVTGEKKAPLLNEIIMKEGRYLEYPAFYVAPDSGNLEWFMDKDATSWL